MNWEDLSAEALFLGLPEPAIILAADGRVLAGNTCAEELFEMPGSFAGLSVTDLLPQPERTRLNPLEWLARWADRPDAPELEYVYLTCRTHTGAEKQLSVRVSKLGASNYLVTMHDVSRWEERLHAERDAHRLAARVLAISADAVVITDAARRVTYANASALALFGYSATELEGMALGELLPARFRSTHDAFMDRFAAETTPARMMGDRRRVLALTKAGEEIPVEASITRVAVRGEQMFSAHLRDLRTREASD